MITTWQSIPLPIKKAGRFHRLDRDEIIQIFALSSLEAEQTGGDLLHVVRENFRANSNRCSAIYFLNDDGEIDQAVEAEVSLIANDDADRNHFSLLEDEARWARIEQAVNDQSIRLTMRKVIKKIIEGRMTHHDTSRYSARLKALFEVESGVRHE